MEGGSSVYCAPGALADVFLEAIYSRMLLAAFNDATIEAGDVRRVSFALCLSHCDDRLGDLEIGRGKLEKQRKIEGKCGD